jgi:predicted HicB family RNase H-like nuclease
MAQEPKDARLNRDVALDDELFREACRQAGIEPTKRQAGKWRRRTGLAFETARKASQREALSR